MTGCRPTRRAASLGCSELGRRPVDAEQFGDRATTEQPERCNVSEGRLPFDAHAPVLRGELVLR